MTDQTNAVSSKAPTHVAYHVRDRDGQKGFWSRIGSAWAHSDGNGYSIQLDSTPIDGRITLRTVADKKE